MRVSLVAFSRPVLGDDPRSLVILAIKTSQGKVFEKGEEAIGYYLSRYPKEKIGPWLASAAAGFPSVLEHVVFSFLIRDISRIAALHLLRHRIASYTQESQRYTEARIIKCLECITEHVAPLLLERMGTDASRKFRWEMLLGVEAHGMWTYVLHQLLYDVGLVARTKEKLIDCLSIAFELSYFGKGVDASLLPLLEALQSYVLLRFVDGLPPEHARYVLPQCVKTDILVTMNLRELLHVACQRLSPKAQEETRKVVEAMIREARKVVPDIDVLLKAYCK